MEKFDLAKVKSDIESDGTSLIFNKQAFLGEVLERDSIEYDRLDLLNQKIQIRVLNTPTSFIFSAYFPESRFSSNRLIRLLTQARPRQHGLFPHPLSNAAIISDWQMPDKLNEDINLWLLKIHTGGLGKEWIEFIKGDRQQFLKAVRSPVSENQNPSSQDTSTFELVPWLVWASDKNSPNRLYLDTPVPEILTDGVGQNANRRLGFILSTALSDKHRDRLPERLGLPESPTRQFMKEPQIPLLVYMYKHELLKGDFFNSAEQFSQLKNTPRNFLSQFNPMLAPLINKFKGLK